MVDRDAICEFGIFMEFWSRNNLRMLEMNGVDSQDAYVAAASLFLTSPYMVGCHREPVVFGNESPSGGIAFTTFAVGCLTYLPLLSTSFCSSTCSHANHTCPEGFSP